MITPPYLKSGDKVGIVAPAGYVQKEQLQDLNIFLQRLDLVPVLGRHLYAKWGSMAGTDQQRATDMQYFLDHPEVKAILCARGGYGSIRILQLLNFERFRVHPKWLVGFSDITLFHNIMQNFGIESLHATMPTLYNAKGNDPLSTKSLIQALFGYLKTYELHQANIYASGTAEGVLVGGNLSILYSVIGTMADIDFKDKILFIEEIGEYDYHIDRMMTTLQLVGHLKHLKALIVGGLDNLRVNDTPFPFSVQELIWEKVKSYDYPVIMDFPVGHREPNLALIMGRKVRLEAQDNICRIHF